MIVLLLAAGLAAPVISHTEIRPSFAGSHMTSAYMTVLSPNADRILDVNCACAMSVEMHQTQIQNGIARMVGPAPVDVPAGQPLVFAPGGRHLMVMGLKSPIKPGQVVTFTLNFKVAGPLKVDFTAPTTKSPATKSPATTSPAHDMGNMPGMEHHH